IYLKGVTGMKTKDAIQNIQYSTNYSDFYYNCQHPNKLIKLQPAHSPHIAGEYCENCGKWLRWVGKKEFSKNYQNTVISHLNGGVR
ncbi:MAG: hypothetical protein ACKPE3_33045, partial [Sphaerospermopsis kisseleviana]